MAPPKRRSELISNDGSDDELSNSSPESANNHSSRKRQRAATEETSIHEDQGEAREESTPPSSLDSDHEEAYEHAATQAIREKHASHSDNIAAECGILEQVHVTNFMCHKNFTFDLGPLINFICGKNGSGKSAILTAIVLCLGGKASATNRGQSLKNFIREGSENGSITVKIKNQGQGAYMPDEYGASIIVERHFSRSGASGFKIKNERGRIISTKKADLDEICDHFALQIDNPLNVLTQDNARAFVTSSSASKKYKFFVKGVQLEQLDTDYRLIEDRLDEIEAKIDVKRPEVKDLEAKMERAKRKKAMSEQHDGVLDKIRHLRRQSAWVQVREQEQIRDDLINAVEEANVKISSAQENIGPLERAFDEAHRTSIEATAAHGEVVTQVEGVQDEHKESKVKHDDIKKKVSQIQGDQRAARSAVQEAVKTIEKRKADISAEEQRIADLDGGGGVARVRALAEAKEAVKESHEAIRTHQGELEQINANKQAAKLVLEDIQRAEQIHQDDVEKRKQALEQFKRNRNQQDMGFDRNLPALLRAIENEPRFAQKPIGPVGKHVRLLKPEWGSILEKSFGATLGSFIVTSKSDMDILTSLKRRTKCQCNIIIGSNRPLDLTGKEPPAEFNTWLRVLEIDNIIVRDQLIIQHGIEQTLLIEDLEEASRTLYSGPRPRNVRQCFCIDPEHRRRGYRLGYTREGKASQDPAHEYAGQSRMRTDFEEQLQLRKIAVEESKIQLNKVSTEKTNRQTALEKANQAAVRHQRQERELKATFQKAEDDVQQLQEAIEEDNIEGGTLDALRNALSDAEETKALQEGSFEDIVTAYDTEKEALKEARAELAQLDGRISGLQEQATRLQSKAQRLSTARAHALGEKNAAHERIKDGENDRNSIARKAEDMEDTIRRFMEQASMISARVNIDEGETRESLERKALKMRETYDKAQERIGGSREAIADEAATTAKAYKGALRDLRNHESIGIKLKGSLIERRERWKKFRSFIAVRARANFTYLLSERSFRGSLIMDHKQKLLELSVEPDITKRDGSGRGARTLSGGEKSFSQICLLLSIWEAMGSPIRCLDEFDVFMDAVNRSMSVNLLVDAARRSIGRQFVLISPGTKADIKSAPDVHVQELAPPQRDQGTLDQYRT